MKRHTLPKHFQFFIFFSTVFLFVTRHSSLVTAAAHVEDHDGLRVVHLLGSPYELGRQHGEALRQEVQASVRQVLGYFRGYLNVPVVGPWLVNWWLDRAWSDALPFIPPRYLEELRGLAEGSGVSLQELYRLHAIPDRTYSCASLAAWGRATVAGRLIHVRNLDWSMRAGIQRYATVFVVHPTGQHAFVNVGWAGFIGVLSGINDAQISVGQIGAKSIDTTLRGEPMVFVLRDVLETAEELDQAAEVVRRAPRTVGVNYVFANARARRAIVLETTHRYVRVFEANDQAEHQISYARPMVDAVFRADTAVDPRIRNQQLASNGDPRRLGLEDPSGSSAYDVRYLAQAAGLQAHFGQLDVEQAREIARAIAPSSNVQSVIFAWPEVWIANADGLTPAAQTRYHKLDAQRLLATPSAGQSTSP